MPIQFKQERLVCHGARDKFWQCLDLNNEDADKCKKLRKEFEKSCSQQWVRHFDRRRKYEKFKAFADDNWDIPEKDKKKL